MAAGSWFTNSGIGDANNAVGRRSLQLSLDSSIKNRSILGHPVILSMMARDAMMGSLLGELGVSVGLVTAGTGKMASTAEGTAATATDWSETNSSTVTPARRAYARKMSDFAVSVQGGLLTGEIGPDAIALFTFDAVGTYVNKLVDDIVATATSATYTIGTSGTSLSWAAINDGVIDMKNRGVTGPALCLLNATQVKAITSDLLGLGGAVQWAPQAQEGIQSLSRGAYVGRINDIDIYLNSELDTSGPDDYGIILTPGSHLLKHQPVGLGVGAQMVADLGFMTMEARRTGGGVSDIEFVSHFGVGILEQVRFAAVISKT
jgi:hypothetical protein